MNSGEGFDSAKVYSAVAQDVLALLLGAAGARAVIYYTGQPDPSSFEAELRKVFGPGADPILKRINDRLEEWGTGRNPDDMPDDVPSSKRRCL